MKKISLMHCADIHFDTAFSGLSPAKAAIRRDELRQTFLRILALCKEKEVDFLLLPGDLFDSTRVTDETISFVTRALGQYPELPVFIAPGNHDPYMPGTRYDSSAWPSNVVIFKEQQISKQIVMTRKGSSVHVYGAAFTTPYLEKNLLDGFSVPADSSADFRLMVLHGDTVGSGQTSAYQPISMQSIAQTGLDYLALGHKHTASQPERQGQTYYAYSGTPEGRGFDELGEKGIWYVELSKEDDMAEARINYTWISCALRIYETKEVDVTGCTSHQEVVTRAEAVIANPDNLYKLVFTGALKDGFLLDLNLLQNRLSDRCFLVKLRDCTHTEVDIQALARENMLRGMFARRLLAKMEDARKKGNTKEEQLYADALALGLKAFEGEVPVYDHQIHQN